MSLSVSVTRAHTSSYAAGFCSTRSKGGRGTCSSRSPRRLSARLRTSAAKRCVCLRKARRSLSFEPIWPHAPGAWSSGSNTVEMVFSSTCNTLELSSPNITARGAADRWAQGHERVRAGHARTAFVRADGGVDGFVRVAQKVHTLGLDLVVLACARTRIGAPHLDPRRCSARAAPLHTHAHRWPQSASAARTCRNDQFALALRAGARLQKEQQLGRRLQAGEEGRDDALLAQEERLRLIFVYLGRKGLRNLRSRHTTTHSALECRHSPHAAARARSRTPSAPSIGGAR